MLPCICLYFHSLSKFNVNWKNEVTFEMNLFTGDRDPALVGV